MSHDDLLMQTLGITIERVRVRHDVAAEKGVGGAGCAASLGLWSDILQHLEAAERYYEANGPAQTAADVKETGSE